MKVNVCVWGWMAVLLCFSPPKTEAEIRKPNILLLYADDMGYGDVSSQHPNPKVFTPHIDRLAAEGMRFTDGHSSSGICTPSRYALLTGRYHWRDFHGIVNSFGQSVFDEERVTLPELLRQEGYATAVIGKWHLGWDWNAVRNTDNMPPPGADEDWKKIHRFDWSQAIPGGPLSHGFDYYFGDDVINFPPYTWFENDRVVQAPDTLRDESLWKKIKEGGWECRPGPMATGWDPYENIPTITRKGVEYIQAQKDAEKPFFLFFSFPSPHAPIIPNDRFDGKSEAGAYGDFVYETDDACGQLLAALKEAGLADNTIVIFTADNGAENYAYGRDVRFDHWSSHPFRGTKRDIYEGGHHVPWIVRWPGVVAPGSTSDALVSQVDIMATLASIIGSPLPEDAAEDSYDMSPVWRGEAQVVRTTMVHNTKPQKYALRENDWVLIDAPNGYENPPRRYEPWLKRHGYPLPDERPFELYNVKKDPGQRHNVAAEFPDRVAEMQQKLKDLRASKHSAPRLVQGHTR